MIVAAKRGWGGFIGILKSAFSSKLDFECSGRMSLFQKIKPRVLVVLLKADLGWYIVVNEIPVIGGALMEQ